MSAEQRIKDQLVAFQQELDVWLDKAEATWGVRPVVDIGDVKVTLAFDIGAFPHKGQTVSLSEPKVAAKRVMAEITSHYTGCQDCGAGVPSLWFRRRYLDGIAAHHGLPAPQSWHIRIPTEAPSVWQGKELGTVIYSWASVLRPPDAMEQATHPVWARQVDKLLSIPQVVAYVESQVQKEVLAL